MLTFLFWNLQKKPLLHRVARIVAGRSVDVVVLAECTQPVTEVLAELNAAGVGSYHYPPTNTRRLRVFSRLGSGQVQSVFDDANARLTIRRILTRPREPVLLAAVHLPSPIGWKEDDRTAFAQEVAADLARIEGRQRHRRTILVGDFNLNPFDAGMVNGFGFHTMMTQELAARRDGRVVQQRPCHPTFFNPMWRFLTDRGPQPAGTFYYHSATPMNHFWHTPDQVLVRPDLAGRLTEVDILDHDGVEPLTVAAGGWPDADAGSDHLPLLFRLDW